MLYIYIYVCMLYISMYINIYIYIYIYIMENTILIENMQIAMKKLRQMEK